MDATKKHASLKRKKNFSDRDRVPKKLPRTGAERAKKARENEDEGAREARLEKNRACTSKARENEDEGAREARLEKNRACTSKVRAAETYQEKAARLAQDNARHAEAREREKKKKKTLDDLWRARLAKCDKYIAKQREVRF